MFVCDQDWLWGCSGEENNTEASNEMNEKHFAANEY